MFGVRLSSLFTSRWFALLWAVLVILTAIQFVGSAEKKDDASASNTIDAAQASAAPVSADGLTDDQRNAIRNDF